MCVCRQEFISEACPDLTKEVYLQDIHCVGSLCKLYFRELPNPLLTYELYAKFTVSTFKVCSLFPQFLTKSCDTKCGCESSDTQKGFINTDQASRTATASLEKKKTTKKEEAFTVLS